MKEAYDAFRARQRANASYWTRWAFRQGQRYYAVHDQDETPESCAPCCSADKWLQTAFMLGWETAAHEDA